MEPDAAESLAAARRAYLIAPAGCGKTEAIALASGLHGGGRQLVLTHTHAGVKALKDRLKKIGAPAGRVHVDTIAGFSLRYAASFPGRSGLPTIQPTTDEEWTAVYEGSRHVLDGRTGRMVLSASFEGLYVDEYQDCTKPQHELITVIAESLPCRVVLDPMQAIFGFAGALVSVEDDLEPTFERLTDLSTPWRWRERNRDLGEWLVGVRADLERGRAVDLTGAPVELGDVSIAAQLATCHRIARRAGSAVAIGQWPSDCHAIGRRLQGVYTCMESIECPDLLAWAARVEEGTGPSRAEAVIDFAAACMTKVSTALATPASKFRAGAIPQPTGGPEVRATVTALIEVASTDDLGAVVFAMAAIDRIPGRVLFRREMWREMGRAIRAFATDRYPVLADAAWRVRDSGRQAGRRVERRTVSRTVLIKGLEFDHAVVLNADRHDAANLYVALTRASSTLTVLSANRLVTPAA